MIRGRRLAPLALVLLAASALSAYVLMGVKWPVGTVMGFYVNPASAKVSGQLPSVLNAAAAWSGLNPIGYRMSYQGPTAIVGHQYDGVNTIGWQDQGVSSTLATTYTWYSGSRILENDIVFNDAQSWSITGGNYDVETVGLHEMGHVVGLDHSAGGIMQAYYAGLQRSIDGDAKAGFYAMYGAPPGGGGAGDRPPTIAIAAPTEGALVSGMVPFTASAADDYGVVRVEFYAGPTLVTRITSSPYSAFWETSFWYNGAYTLKAVALDTIGQTAEAQVGVVLIPHAPGNFLGLKKNNSSTLLEQYINVFTWEAHAYNRNIQGYRLYRQDGSSWTLIGEYDAGTVTAMDRNVPKTSAYTYSLRAIDSSGRAGDAAVFQVK
jgi:hypothetical protein